jgi:phenylpropionate dioxygenase-like ring-hydroxylating dioxygenase large terminal subunit
MLRKEENEYLCHIGPGTPMGAMFRQYWLPALLSSELPGPDSDPVRVMLLGEQLIAFRDTNGAVGLLQNNCPHRGASLFFGRNEEAGLRCVYHGWKFSASGECIDMPNEPAESDFRTKVRATAYPTAERGGIIWAYMGTRSADNLPPLPDLEANMVPDATVTVTMQPANWMQILEGHIDTLHAGFLHYGSLKSEDQPAGTFSEYQIKDRTATFEVIDTEAGSAYGAYRQAGPGETYWRIAQWMFPSYSISPPGVLGMGKRFAIEVPMDDYHTLIWQASVGRGRPNSGLNLSGASRLKVLPNSTDWFGRFRTQQNIDNDFLIDRDLQRSNSGTNGYTGIEGIPPQDAAMTVSMGPIYDRSQEHLGTSDMMVIRVRRRLIAAARALEEHGIEPPGVECPEGYRVRGGQVFLPEGADWVEATRELRKAFVEHPELDASIKGPLN